MSRRQILTAARAQAAAHPEKVVRSYGTTPATERSDEIPAVAHGFDEIDAAFDAAPTRK